MGETGYFGVYVGNTSATIAICKDDKADVLAADNGERVTPAYVGFHDGEKVVGRPAQQSWVRRPRSVLHGITSVLGLSNAQARAEGLDKVFKLEQAVGDVAVFAMQDDDKTFQVAPLKALHAVFSQLLETGRSSGVDSVSAVAVVPYSFSEERRVLLKKAAVAAGLDVLRVISAPAAALLAYGVGQADPKQTRTAVVVRVGGKSSEVSIMRVVGGLYQCVTSQEDASLGGDSCNEPLVKHMLQEFKRVSRGAEVGGESRGWRRLWQAVVNTKHILATLPTAHCSVDSLHDGMDFHASLTRPRFESLITSHLQRLQELVKRTLGDASLQPQDIDTVVLVGGGCKATAVQQTLSNVFPGAEVLSSIPPDEVLARGAALQCSILGAYEAEEVTRHEQQTAVMCLPAPLVLKEEGREAPPVTLLAAYTPAPARHTSQLDLPPHTRDVTYLVAEGGGDDLAKLVLSDLPEGAAQVSVTARLGRDGHVHVTVTEMQSSQSAEVTIEAS